MELPPYLSLKYLSFGATVTYKRTNKTTLIEISEFSRSWKNEIHIRHTYNTGNKTEIALGFSTGHGCTKTK